MPATVPTSDEFEQLKQQLVDLTAEVADLEARVEALEDSDSGPIDPPPLTGSLRAEVTIGGEQYVFSEYEAIDIGDYNDPDRRFVMTCKRDIHLDLMDYRVDFRRLGNWCCVVCDYGNGLIQSEPVNLGPHSVKIIDDEGTEHRFELASHWFNARWRWQSGPWPTMLRRGVEDLIARNWLPNLDPSVNRNTAGHLGVPHYEPMGLAGLNPNMPDTGGRADIGFVTDWQGEYLCEQSEEMLEGVLAQGEAAATVPFHFRDPNTGCLLDLFNDWRYASCYWTGNDSVNPYIQQAKNTGIVIDVAHMPAMAWVPFAITGDPYYLESQQAMANYAFLDTPRSYEWVWQMPGSGQTRAMAWNLRTIAQALAGTPDEVPSWILPKSVMQQMLEQCVKGLDCIMNEGGANRTALHCIDVGLPGFDTWNEFGVYPANCYSHPWQTSFFCQSAAFGATLHAELRPVAGYIAKNIIERTIGDIWNSSYPAEYCLLLRPAYEASWFEGWETCWAANEPLLPPDENKNQLKVFGDYHGGVYAGLSALTHARTAGVTSIPGEIDEALGRYANQMDALLTAGGNNYLTWNNSYCR